MSDVVVLRRESVVTMVQGAPSSPVVAEREAPTIIIQRDGIPGPQGNQGEQGLPGDAANVYVHTQSTPSDDWTVNHNLGLIPSSVAILNSGAREIEADILHTSVNQFHVYFVSQQVGTARVSA